MTKATRIINKYHIKEILLNGNPQFENFYKEELVQFCEVAREILKQYQKENQELKKQLEYLKREEYYNQLRFERDMLWDVVDNGEVSKEDKEFIDCTHRNTELLEENEKLKKQLEEQKELLNKFKIQQKEFIKHLEDEVKIYSNTYMGEMLKELEEILQKYKEIIGDDK